MDNVEISKCLKSLEENHAKKFKNDKNYINKCKSYNGLSPKDFKIDPHHNLDEYFARYGKKLQKGKVLVYKKDELWLMNQDVTYWKIENDSEFVYFALPYVNKKPIIVSLASLLIAGAVAGGGTAGVLLRPKEVEPEPQPPLHPHWYEYTEEEKWWEHCSNGGPEAAVAEDVGKEVEITLDTIVHKVRLIGVDHVEPNETTAQAHCTFEFVNTITKSDNSDYWIAYDATTRNNCNFLVSDLNVTLQPGGDVYSMFPTEEDSLINTMTEVTKYVAHNPSKATGESNYVLTSYTTKLFPLAYYEMSATSDAGAKQGEGNTYTYYQDHTTAGERLKRNVGGTARDSVLRSPTTNTYSTSCMWEVESDGDFANNGYVYYTRAVAPAFCI